MPTSNESPKQPSKPRKSTRASKAVAPTSETEVPIATASAADTAGLNERIRLRAYEIYLARGDDSRSAVDDWLEAERQLRAL
jgi:hypothetical protein